MAAGNEETKGITVKSERELDLMREAGSIIAEAKAEVRDDYVSYTHLPPHETLS